MIMGGVIMWVRFRDSIAGIYVTGNEGGDYVVALLGI